MDMNLDIEKDQIFDEVMVEMIFVFCVDFFSELDVFV